jgi:hypothetical protein
VVFAAEIPCSEQSLGCIGKAASASKGAAKKRTGQGEAEEEEEEEGQAMKKGSHASPEERKRMKEAQLRASRLSYVTPEQLEACRLDPAWEARQSMANCVVCRECGAKLQAPLGGNKGHLWRRHQMTVCAYRAVYRGARARPDPAR